VNDPADDGEKTHVAVPPAPETLTVCELQFALGSLTVKATVPAAG
jgi:hypothetical protein